MLPVRLCLMSTIQLYSRVCSQKWILVGGGRFTNAQTASRISTSCCYCQAKKKIQFDISSNPYFTKYEEKLQALSKTDPEKYYEKMRELEDKLNPKKEPEKTGNLAAASSVSQPKKEVFVKGLDDIVKLDLLKDRSPKEIEQIWKQYHCTKDCIFSVLKELDYEVVMDKAKICPAFIYPLPHQDGYEFILQHFSGRNVYFTPLIIYQRLQENAPPCLSIQHFTELKNDKGLVLMSGSYDNTMLKKSDALNLLRQMSVYYGRFAAERFNLVRSFNHMPEKFKYNDVINEYKGMKDFVESL